MALSCWRKIFTDLLEHDGLLVMGPGLGLPIIVAKFLKLYHSSSGLVLVVNASGDERLLREVLQADGVAAEALPVVVDAELPAPERKELYARGGCVFVTSRILVVDLLHGRVERGRAAGVLLLHAHRVWEDSLEAWAVQLFAEQNPGGFVKAFSDDPEALTSGFGRLGKVMRAARVPKLFLWPRFQAHMARDLERSAPEVVELSAPLTPLMVAVQRAVIECLDGCLDELRRCTHVDVSELTRENGLFERFDVTIRRQLQPVWNTLKARTRYVVADLRVLRKLLGYLLRYDALTFFDFLDKLRFDALQAAAAARTGAGVGPALPRGGASNASAAASPSEWLLTDAGDRLYRAAKARLYSVVDLGPAAAAPAVAAGAEAEDEAPGAGPKRKRAAAAAAAVAAESCPSLTGHPGLDSLEVTDRRAPGRPAAPQHAPPPLARRVGLRFVLERNPKWTALAEVLAEVDPLVAAATAAAPQQRGAGGGSERRAPAPGCSVLVAARDDRTAYLLRSVLSHGADALLQTGMSRFLSKHVARTRRPLALVLASEALAQQPSGAERAALERALSQLAPEEQQLLLAAEIPGWPDKGQQPPHAAAREPPFRSLLSVAPPSPDDWAIGVEAEPHGDEGEGGGGSGGAGPSALAAVAAALVPGARLDAAAAVVGEGNAPRGGSDAAAAAAAAQAAAVIPEAGAGHAQPDARRAAPPPQPPPAPPAARPVVLPEIRLLWKAAAHELIRCRVDQSQRHDSILRAMGADAAAAAVLLAPTRVPGAEAASAAAAADAAGGAVVDLCSDDDDDDTAAGGVPKGGAEAAAADRKALAATIKAAAGAKPLQPKKKRKVAAAGDGPGAAALHPDEGAAGAHGSGAGLPSAAAAATHARPVGPPLRLELLPRTSTVTVFPLSRMEARACLLRDLRPSVVVMFDPDPAFTREVEVYKATSAAATPLRVYIIVAPASADEQRFLSAIRKERAAFERLIHEKAHMAAPVPRGQPSAEAAEAVRGPARKGAGGADAWGITSEGAGGGGGGVGGALATLLGQGGVARYQLVTGGTGGGAGPRPLTVDLAGVADTGRRVVVADLREFRAKLPFRLYNAGLDPRPATLEVGDYVLSPGIVVERKSVPDLLGSLSSGRLYTQAAAMIRSYKFALLCIEFDEDRPFALQTGDVPAEMDIFNPISKLVLLLLHFPSLRLLWARTPAATAAYFAMLKQPHPEPDVATAAAVGTEREGTIPVQPPPAAGAQQQPPPLPQAAFAAAAAAAERAADRAAREAELSNQPGIDLLRKLPGVTAGNVGAVMAAAGSLAGLARLSEAQLVPAMGAGNAALLHRFLHTRHAPGL